MNKTIELSTGKIVDLSRFVALIPDGKTAEKSRYSHSQPSRSVKFNQ